MREARIILPLYDNDGIDLQDVHKSLKTRLCAEFGGYTATPSMGGWIDNSGKLYEEPGIAYDVAVPDDSIAIIETLRDIAGLTGRKANQKAMYLRLPTGKVEILDTEDLPVEIEIAA